MSHRGRRAPNPPQQRRRARLEAFERLLPRLERGTLTDEERTLLAAYMREELRITEEVRGTLRATQTSLRSIREATDTAVQEAEERAEKAEERAREAEERAAALEEKGQPGTLAFDGSRSEGARSMILHVVSQPAAEQDAQRAREQEEGERARCELRRRAVADVFKVSPVTPWPTLIAHVQEAHTWALRAREYSHELFQLREQVARLLKARGGMQAALRAARIEARQATSAALRLQNQTSTAAQSTLAQIRAARSWAEVWVPLGIYYGLKPEQAGLEARERRVASEREIERQYRADVANRQAIAQALRVGAHLTWGQLVVVADRTRAAYVDGEAAARRYRHAWESARGRARDKEAKRAITAARMEHATRQAAQLSVELEDARTAEKRAQTELQQWRATFGDDVLRDTVCRLKSAEAAVARVKALRDQARDIAPFAQGPTWESLWEALGGILDDPARTLQAARCVPGAAASDHPVVALLSALTDEQPRRTEEAIDLTHAYYEAIHSACCLLDHRDPRPGRTAEAIRRIMSGHVRMAPAAFVKL